MISEFFSTMGDVATGLLGNLTTAATGVVPIFWDPTNNKFTVIGLLLIIGVGGSIVWFVFRLIRGLFTRGGARS